MAQTIKPGTPVSYIAESTAGPFAAVFEDHGGIGFFFALDTHGGEKIVDALLIYNVHAGAPDHEAVLEITWSEDGLKSMLLMNGTPQAIFDFEAKLGSCRTNIPAPKQWRREPWNEVA